MKRLFAVVVMCASFAMPLGVAAQGGSVMGGAGGGSMTGRTSATGAGAPTIGGAGAMPIASGEHAPARMSEGEVRKVDSAAGKLTLRHSALRNLDMPAMTMVFRVRNPAWLRELEVGDKVRFVAERVDGNLTVVALEPEKK